MIQRVQSVYLLLVSILMSFMVVWAYAELTLDETHQLTFRAHAIIMNAGSDSEALYNRTLPLLFMILITSLLSFVNIFMYHHRILQIRLGLVNFVLLVSLLIVMFVYYTFTKTEVTVVHHSFRLPAILPLVSIIFNLMAIRAIQHDELLVNSYNRIR